ncbi:MAG: dihydrolipoyl dehydrogenase [Pleomorphochaeta sp.]
MKSYELLFIGAGPGGYVAAIRAAQLGAKVAVIENREAGGTCLNRGCIPTKALYKSAEVLRESRELASFGLDGTAAKANISAIQKRKNGIVKQLRDGVITLLSENNVDYYEGLGSFIDKKNVKVTLNAGGEEILSAPSIIIATGSSPKKLALPGSDLNGVITTDELLEIDHIPRRLGVIGAGTVGTEFANIFNSFGSDVYVVVKYDRVMRKLDKETVYEFMKSFKNQGIHMVEGVLPQRFEKTDNGIAIISKDLKTEEEVITEVDEILLSAGRKANTVGLNLENAGVMVDSAGFVKVDDNYKTNVPGIYAIGDVIGKQMLAHVASAHGEKLVESIIKHTFPKPMTPVPDCVFAYPEIATCGISEEQAQNRKLDYKVGKFKFASNGKAMTLGETEGLIKVIAGKDNKILGVNICGPHASDLIHEASTAMTAGLTIKQINNTIHAHPTLIETFSEAVLDVDNKSIHAAPKCAFISSSEKKVDPGKVRLPKLNSLMTKGRVCNWNVELGQHVKKGDVLCSVEANKVNGEITAPVDGKIIEIKDQNNETVDVGTLICVIQSALEAKAIDNEIKMPKLNNLMSKGTIASWKANVGDKMKKGDVLCSVEANKVSGEITLPRDCEIVELIAEVGKEVEVNSIVAKVV